MSITLPDLDTPMHHPAEFEQYITEVDVEVLEEAMISGGLAAGLELMPEFCAMAEITDEDIQSYPSQIWLRYQGAKVEDPDLNSSVGSEMTNRMFRIHQAIRVTDSTELSEKLANKSLEAVSELFFPAYLDHVQRFVARRSRNDSAFAEEVESMLVGLFPVFVNKYDPEVASQTFMHFCRAKFRNRMIDLDRQVSQTGSAASKIMNGYKNVFGLEPEQISHPAVNEDTIKGYRNAVNGSSPMRLDRQSDDGSAEADSLRESLQDPEMPVFDQVELASKMRQMEALLNQLVETKRLSERNAAVFFRAFASATGMNKESKADIALEFEITPSRVSHIVKRASQLMIESRDNDTTKIY